MVYTDTFIQLEENESFSTCVLPKLIQEELEN